jgi:hypothetical protein
MLWWQTRLIEGMRRLQSAEGAWLRELIRDLDSRPEGDPSSDD